MNVTVRSLAKKIKQWASLKQFDYKQYWDDRYVKGGDSGGGSYGEFAEHKARVINDFVATHKIKTVIDVGCGDGNQLRYFFFQEYVGLDVSQKAIDLCKRKFKYDFSKQFHKYVEGIGIPSADLVICLDVLYHVIDEKDFKDLLDDVFRLSHKYVILYTNLQKLHGIFDPHIKFRNIWEYLPAYTDFEVVQELKPEDVKKNVSGFIFLRRKDGKS